MRSELFGFSVKRPVTTLMMILACITMGMVSYMRIPRRHAPEQEYPTLHIRVRVPESSPKDLAREILIPLEDIMSTVTHLNGLNGYAGTSDIWLNMSFDWGTDMDLVFLEVKEKLDRFHSAFFDQINAVNIYRRRSEDWEAMGIVLYWPGRQDALQAFADRVIRPRLARIPGVADINIHGLSFRELNVEIHRAMLHAHGVDVPQVVQAIRQNNQNVSCGKIRHQGKAYYLRVIGQFVDADEIRHLPIKATGLRISDVASVREAFPERRRSWRTDGTRTLYVQVYKASNGNFVQISNRVRTLLRSFAMDERYAGFAYKIRWDNATSIKLGLRQLRNAGIVGGLLAGMVLFLFLRKFRNTLIVVTAIPISIIFTFAVMYLARLAGSAISINRISLSGLMLGTGMLLDNAVVVLENILRRKQSAHLSAKDAAIQGASEVGLAVVSATATTICVFIPVFFMQDSALAFDMKEFGMTICTAVISSLLVAFTLIPLLASRWHVVGLQSERSFIKTLQRAYAGVIGKTLQYRTLTLSLSMAGLVGGIWLYRHIERQPVPREKANRIRFNVKLPRFYDFETAEGLFAVMERTLLDNKDRLDIVSVATYCRHDGGYIRVRLVTRENAGMTLQETRDAIRNALPELAGVQYEPVYEGIRSDDVRRLRFRLVGDRPETLRVLSEEIVSRLDRLPQTKDVWSDLKRGRWELQVSLNRAKSYRAGVSPNQVARTLRSSLSGAKDLYLRTGQYEKNIHVLLDEDDRKNLSDIRGTTMISHETAVPVTLVNIGTFKHSEGERPIHREARQPIVMIYAQLHEGYHKMDVMADVAKALHDLSIPPGFTLQLDQWQREAVEKESRDAGFVLLFAAVLIYMIMAALFESFLQPLVIMLSIPFGFIGVAVLFYVTGTSLNGLAYLGLVILSGIAVNNGIVFVDHMNQLRRRGMTIHAAMMQGGQNRLLPIMITAITTLLGLFPMAAPLMFPTWFGPVRGTAADAYGPVALAVIGGLLTSTVMTLIILPTMYSLVNDLANGARSLRYRVTAADTNRPAQTDVCSP